MPGSLFPHTPPMASDSSHNYCFEAIGHIHSPYREKFAVPRQPGLVTAARAELVLSAPCNREEIVRGLEDFSHLWITFVFHQVLHQGWKPTVRPPRLGGNRRVGVFATRSPFRPNAIGLSVVALHAVEKRGDQWLLVLGGVDVVDGTPVLDIKPYLPYADALPDARGGFASEPPSPASRVSFSDTARRQLAQHSDSYPHLAQLIEQVIAQRPRPAYHRDDGERLYGMTLYDLNIQWRDDGGASIVEAIQTIAQ